MEIDKFMAWKHLKIFEILRLPRTSDVSNTFLLHRGIFFTATPIWSSAATSREPWRSLRRPRVSVLKLPGTPCCSLETLWIWISKKQQEKHCFLMFLGVFSTFFNWSWQFYGRNDSHVWLMLYLFVFQFTNRIFQNTLSNHVKNPQTKSAQEALVNGCSESARKASKVIEVDLGLQHICLQYSHPKNHNLLGSFAFATKKRGGDWQL